MQELIKMSDYHYDLPKELIAQTPLADRSDSRLMVLDRKTGEISNGCFRDVQNYIDKNDCLVLNETKVFPARLIGSLDSGGRIELLLLRRIDETRWECLVNPGKKAKIGREIRFGDALGATVEDMAPDGGRIIRFRFDGIFEEILDALGQMPLPPYITEKLSDRNRYQTVYAKNTGSAAAPTAGLHFTDTLLGELEAKGVRIARLTLHVGLGTFRPVKTEFAHEHKMHSEYFDVSEEAASIINNTRKNGGKIIAVGTTSVRTLETCADENGVVLPKSGNTSIFITPGYRFKATDRLITNFHLPESTLMLLVSALAGKENIMNAYNTAVAERYRFFSFGDAMFVV